MVTTTLGHGSRYQGQCCDKNEAKQLFSKITKINSKCIFLAQQGKSNQKQSMVMQNGCPEQFCSNFQSLHTLFERRENIGIPKNDMSKKKTLKFGSIFWKKLFIRRQYLSVGNFQCFYFLDLGPILAVSFFWTNFGIFSGFPISATFFAVSQPNLLRF